VTLIIFLANLGFRHGGFLHKSTANTVASAPESGWYGGPVAGTWVVWWSGRRNWMNVLEVHEGRERRERKRCEKWKKYVEIWYLYPVILCAQVHCSRSIISTESPYNPMIKIGPSDQSTQPHDQNRTVRSISVTPKLII
jgi:hypothetical protein